MSDLFVGLNKETLAKIKDDLDELHLWKIRWSDEVLILNVDGYIGKSTANELAYARSQGKTIRFLEEIS